MSRNNETAKQLLARLQVSTAPGAPVSAPAPITVRTPIKVTIPNVKRTEEHATPNGQVENRQAIRIAGTAGGTPHPQGDARIGAATPARSEVGEARPPAEFHNWPVTHWDIASLPVHAPQQPTRYSDTLRTFHAPVRVVQGEVLAPESQDLSPDTDEPYVMGPGEPIAPGTPGDTYIDNRTINVNVNVTQRIYEKRPENATFDEALARAEAARNAAALESMTVLRLRKPSLVEDHIELDESQLAAVAGLARTTHGCLTGAAGTGKTTTTKALIDAIQDEVSTINLNEYGKQDDERSADDAWESARLVPSICLCAFTGRASQMIKKNFPESWHGNIMTIHRMLRYYPEYYDDEILDANGYGTGEVKTKRRFIPFYTAANKMPWDVIVIDEASMLAIDLWENVLAACKSTTRIYMVGDINQLPPVQGRSIYGFAMSDWPSFELTHIHRQKGEDNPIVENAWRILQGRVPVAVQGKITFVKIPTDSVKAQPDVLKTLRYMRDKKLFDPANDTIITAINGREKTVGKEKRFPLGYQLGQHPLNERLVHMFNPGADRKFVDAGREILHFALGDKVMVTKNDHQQGITNGMTGTITQMTEQAGYQGKLSSLAQAGNLTEEDTSTDFLSGLAASLEGGSTNVHKAKEEDEKRLRGPSNYSITVDFPNVGEITFNTLSEVGTLQLAYAITCHKSQGGEYNTVVIIACTSHGAMINREWLYTAITRAKEKVVFLYNEATMYSGVGKQSIKGKNLAEKVKAFQTLQNNDAIATPVLPKAREI